jgi:hypothetical protein
MDTNVTIPLDDSGAEPRKKYIRTFEGDMETLKKGGVPDLALFSPPTSEEQKKEEPKPDAKPVLQAEPIVVKGLPAQEPVSLPPLGQLPRLVLEKRDVLDTTLPPEPKPEPAPPPELHFVPPPPPPPPKPVPPPVMKPSPIETYANDFSDRIKDTHASMTTVLAAEQDAAKGVPKATPKETSSNRLYMVGGALLLIVGIAGAVYAYMKYATAIAPIIIAPVVTAPIFVDDRVQVTGTGSALAQTLEQSITVSMPTDTVRLLYFSPSTTTNESVFTALRIPAPDMLLRNVNASGSMAGVVSEDGTQSLFFILSVASYSDTFAGMLSWEPTMLRDMGAFFPPYPAPAIVVATTTTATTTASKSKTTKTTATTTVITAPVVPRGFKDEIVSNHDVRIYRDEFGQSVILYGYWNRTTLVIARNPAAFIEILGRLSTSRSNQ